MCGDDRSIYSCDDGPSIELAAGADCETIITDGKISTANNTRQVCFRLNPDSSGTCYFAVLAVPYPVTQNKRTVSVRQALNGDSFTVVCEFKEYTLRFILSGNKLKKEEIRHE